MITMQKQTLQEMVFLQIAMMDEDSDGYRMFCDILLTALGVVDPDGVLTPAYADSPMWTLINGDVLVPSVQADLASIMLGDDLSREHVESVMQTLGVDQGDADALHQWLGDVAKA